jgi:hypothetical protein
MLTRLRFGGTMPYCHHIILLYLFAKNDTADLSAQTTKQLAKLMSQIKEAIK